MGQFLIAGFAGGILFAVLDGVINANPTARKLYEAFKPVAKTTLNPIKGIVIDLVFGFAMAGVFLLLYNSLPGGSGLVKGLSFGLLAWFFRVVMSVASQWMMFNVPGKTLIYTAAAGLVEMTILGAFYGLTLEPIL